MRCSDFSAADLEFGPVPGLAAGPAHSSSSYTCASHRERSVTSQNSLPPQGTPKSYKRVLSAPTRTAVIAAAVLPFPEIEGLGRSIRKVERSSPATQARALTL